MSIATLKFIESVNASDRHYNDRRHLIGSMYLAVPGITIGAVTPARRWHNGHAFHETAAGPIPSPAFYHR